MSIIEPDSILFSRRWRDEDPPAPLFAGGKGDTPAGVVAAVCATQVHDRREGFAGVFLTTSLHLSLSGSGQAASGQLMCSA